MSIARDATTVSCGCCGNTYPEAEVHRLGFQPEAAICHGCARWVAGSTNRAIPVLATPDVPGSVRFWEAAGFDVELYSEDFAIAAGHGVELHLVGPSREAQPGGGCYLHLRDVDDLQAIWVTAGVPVSDVVDKPWGMREFHVTDPGDNHVRVGQNV